MPTDFFRPLFSIECSHGYYRNGICEDLQIVPTWECEQILRGHRLLFKERPTGAVVIREERSTGMAAPPVLVPTIPLRPKTTFTFSLILRNPYFLSLTDMDQTALRPSSVFVFPTEGLPGTLTGGVRHIAAHQGFLNNPVEVVGEVFRHRVAPVLQPATAEVSRGGAAVLFSAFFPPGSSEVHIDLTGFSEGMYSLRTLDAPGTVVETKPLFLSRGSRPTSLFGFLQVSLANPSERYRFTLDFDARQIPWVYHVNVKEIEPGHPDNLDPTKIELMGKTATSLPTTFSTAISAAVPTRVTFQSNSVIALREEPYTGIQVVENSGLTPKVLVRNAPNPEVTNLVRDTTTGLKSEIFITVQ